MDEKALKSVQETLEKSLENVEENIKGSLQEMVDQKIDSSLEKLNLTREEAAKGKVPYGYNGEGKTGSEVIGNFIKGVFMKDAAVLSKSMTEGVDSDGGFTVPEEFHNEIMRLSKDYGLIPRFSARFPMGSDTLNVPTEATSVTSYWPGEAQNGTESQPVLSNAPLNAKTLVGITVTSNELLRDSNVDITNYLMGIFAESFAGEIDAQGFAGTGSPFLGILGNDDVTTVTMETGKDTFAETTLGDLRDLISQVNVTCLPTAAFYMNKATYGIIQKIQENSQTVAAFQNYPLNQGADQGNIGLLRPHGMLWGYPVYLTDKITGTSAVSTEFVVFGSLAKGMFWGDRQAMQMGISQDATIGSTNLFQSNQSAVRLTQRLALKVGLPGAFATLKTAAS